MNEQAQELYETLLIELDANPEDSGLDHIGDGFYRANIFVNEEDAEDYKFYSDKLELLQGQIFNIKSWEFWLPDPIWIEDQVEIRIGFRV